MKKSFILLTVVTITLASLMFPAYKQGESQEINKGEAHYQKGLSYFHEGFYKLMPKGKKKEALQNYAKAILEFKKAIAINESHVEAHLNLARVYYVQKKFSQAAEEYKRVTELTPSDIDVYVKLALTYARINKYSEAIEQLEKAKTFTNEAVVINQLNDLIKKLEEGK